MMKDVAPRSPEERGKALRRAGERVAQHVGPGTRAFQVLQRTASGAYNDGFMHAGNLAYLTLLTLFPFFIVTAAIASLIGRSADTIKAVEAMLDTLPPSVATLLEQPIADVLHARTGPLLWFGALVGLWTVGSFIETIRDILRRAYGTPWSRPFWHYRLGSLGIIFGSVALMMAAFSVQLMLVAAEEFLVRLVPEAGELIGQLSLGSLAPMAVLFVALYLLFWSLTPLKYKDCPKWPGAVFTTLWWYGSLRLLPRVLELFEGYALTYGGLAGVIVALLFFWLVGYGLVVGVHLNAALAEPHDPGVEGRAQPEELAEAK